MGYSEGVLGEKNDSESCKKLKVEPEKVGLAVSRPATARLGTRHERICDELNCGERRELRDSSEFSRRRAFRDGNERKSCTKIDDENPSNDFGCAVQFSMWCAVRWATRYDALASRSRQVPAANSHVVR